MMRYRKRRVAQVMFIATVSIFGLVVSAALIEDPALVPAYSNGRRIIVMLAYDLVCIMGVLAALFPVACSGAKGFRLSLTEAHESSGLRAGRFLGITIVHSHHASDSELSRHEFLLRGRRFCATCYGLLGGAAVSLTTITLFALSGWLGWTGNYPAYLVYAIGVAAVIAGLTQTIVAEVGAKMRFSLSFVFVVGTGLMLLATDLLAANLMADLFIIVLSVFWLLSRVSLSHRD